MHPFLTGDLAAAHMADLMREAAAQCCSRVASHPLLDRLRAAVRRATAALHGPDEAAAPSCCPA